MADHHQMDTLSGSVEAWNAWRTAEPGQSIDLDRAHLSDEDLSGADLREAVLHRADLIGASLRGSDLQRASLVGALLLGADLTGANLAYADFRAADVRGADLSEVDLRQVLFLTQAQIESARGSASTRLPEGMARPEHWLA